ncbi:MAG: preprotein translocase subunit YajC [Peptoniphilus sp. oral taxon 375]|uniref:Preprotein translocase subunit YajC n=1 Tax=Urinicoccus massiliensis TaxID=1723382 RepID=A0A8H2M561_9FIRM|nr:MULTISPECIES: preprotein translocase subunit YajC [Urinicoccus]EGS31037.1 preprotein translocase, YajC subunit [Peptoniphilus sp. oral taxon 375 str. F0436]KGF09971.1 preprotein translocase subunit YajC [Tissierellia bacterium S5-A11]MBS4871369.1 preprotein translocase subunit YajC [Peptoniphilus sp. oral taxon 375]VFB16321.1 preprotein translocase subunit YajC [Urinicoccus massiliensis]
MDLIGSLQSPFIRSIIPMVVMLAFFYFVLVRPQKKREKTVDDMRNNLKVGDEILTIGGLMGKIIMVKEDYVVIESSGLNTRIDVMKWGVHSVTKSK